MATVFDVGLFEYFKPIFTFLFVFAIVFAILEKTKILGDNKNFNSIIAVSAALLFMLSPDSVKLVNLMTPWFIVLFVSLVLLVITFLAIGIKEEAIVATFKRDWVVWILVTIILLAIVGVALSKVYRPVISGVHGKFAEDQTGTSYNIGKILFNPKLLGAFLVLFIAAYTVRLISRTAM